MFFYYIFVDMMGAVNYIIDGIYYNLCTLFIRQSRETSLFDVHSGEEGGCRSIYRSTEGRGMKDIIIHLL